MADKKNTPKQEKTLEREYTIPLRKKYQHVARYKKTPKAIKSIKEFLVRHMNVRDRDLKKIKLDRYLNETLWMNGIKNPPHKIKVKAVKRGDIVNVSIVELPGRLEFKQKREEKQEKEAKQAAEKKKSKMEEMKKQTSASKKPGKEEESEEEGGDKKETKDSEKKEKEATSKEAEKQLEKKQAKKQKHQTSKGAKQPKHPKRKTMTR